MVPTKAPPIETVVSNLKRMAAETELPEKAGALRDAVIKIEKLAEIIRALGAFIHSETAWKFPLSDGVFVEVTINGPYTKSHVKRFAALFAAVAENYQMPAPDPCTTEAPEKQPQQDQ